MKLKEFMAQERGHEGPPQSVEEERCWEWEFRAPPRTGRLIVGYLAPPPGSKQVDRVVYYGSHKWETPISKVTISQYPCVATASEMFRRQAAASKRKEEGKR